MFVEQSPAGHFRDKDPTVDRATLHEHWVADCPVLYIGKARRARRRLRQYAGHGAGKPVGHWGGRYIWQLADATDLLVAWHVITWGEDPREYEKRLLKHFARLHQGRRPFANRVG